MEFRLLGQVELRVDDQVVDAGPPQQRHVLAALAVDAGRPVTSEHLIDRVWDGAPPAAARRTLHVYLTRLRRLLGDGALPRHSGGYLLDVAPDRVDLHRFRGLLDRARHGPDAERLPLLRTALRLWNGEPLAGLPGDWADRTRQAWCGRYVDAVLAWADAELRDGDPGSVVGPLAELVGEHPLLEPLTAALMRGLHAAGRTADALDRYEELRRRLAVELGVDPSAGVREAHRAILRDDTGAERRPAPRRVPAQLPADVGGFVARRRELRRLDELLAGAGDQPTAVVISALAGTAGAGKTALAVHWAHRVRDRFPDGQLYLNLQGYDADGAPLASADAVRLCLDALGVPPEGVPAEPAAAAALYRTLLADRRALVLLDNARDAAQVRPLLPGAPGCFVLVTSRDQLAGLVAGEGAHAVPVELFSPAEARQLLARRLGADRLAGEPAAVEEIVARCARLPLALAVVAARAAAHPAFPLAWLAEELREAHLDALGAGDPDTDVRTVFSWSYRWLSPPAARLFRLLGLHPGPDVSTRAAASLAGLPLARTRRLLAELTRAHLVTEHTPGRYACHDLLRAYAAELAGTVDADADRDAAVHRMLDHYLHTGQDAAVLVEPHQERIVKAPPRPGVTVEPLDDHRPALDWFRAHHRVLLAVARLAAGSGFDRHTWELGRVFAGLLDNQGRWRDLIAVQRLAVEAAGRLGEQADRAWATRLLGRAYASLHRYGEADTAYRSALALYERLGDPDGQAAVHFALASLGEVLGCCEVVRRHCDQALRLYTGSGNRLGRGRALNFVGWTHALHGDLAAAMDHCTRALALQEELGDRVGQAATWDSIGYVHHHRGEYDRAVECYERALGLYRRCGDRYNEASALTHLGDTHHAAGRPGAARETWRLAADILTELGDPLAAEIEARPAALAAVSS